MKLYYLLNYIWVYGNIAMIIPFLIAGINRFFHKGKDLKHHLFTDHLARICLIFTISFYIIETIVKYPIDGADTVCKKTFLIHHMGSILIIAPLIINRYIPWWVNPIGFMHGFLMAWPQAEWMNYVYTVFLFIFQNGLYQSPYKNLRLYWLSRFSINYIWIFALMFLFGKCTNYLELAEPV